MTTEADTCRKFILPKLLAAGWEDEPHSLNEQRTFTDGRIYRAGKEWKRKPQKRADYILRYTRDFPIAVVEAKREDQPAADGLQQAKEYAEILGLKFAYATNGHDIIEFDSITGKESNLAVFPTPEELWKRYSEDQQIPDEETKTRLLTPYNLIEGKEPRYYQDIAINRVVQSILQGENRILVTMATGCGKGSRMDFWLLTGCIG